MVPKESGSGDRDQKSILAATRGAPTRCLHYSVMFLRTHFCMNESVSPPSSNKCFWNSSFEWRSRMTRRVRFMAVATLGRSVLEMSPMCRA